MREKSKKDLYHYNINDNRLNNHNFLKKNTHTQTPKGRTFRLGTGGEESPQKRNKHKATRGEKGSTGLLDLQAYHKLLCPCQDKRWPGTFSFLFCSCLVLGFLSFLGQGKGKVVMPTARCPISTPEIPPNSTPPSSISGSWHRCKHTHKDIYTHHTPPTSPTHSRTHTHKHITHPSQKRKFCLSPQGGPPHCNTHIPHSLSVHAGQMGHSQSASLPPPLLD